MSSERVFSMELELIRDVESYDPDKRTHLEFWPLGVVDFKKARFPCCVVWTPLPVVSWLAPFIGHLGICREDGVIMDFSGSNFVNIDNFAYGSVARYLQLDREQCCFPPNLASHLCKNGFKHSEYGTSLTWDDALRSSMNHFEHKSYNLFTCNCHSYVANCMNRLCYGGSLKWNMVNVAALIFLKGCWVDSMSVVRSFLPFVVVLCLGLVIAGWPFIIGLSSFSMLLFCWFILGSYCMKGVLEC
ncbi:hypothetical protein Scep_007731 [Stephania cephalantha]|uniref:Protein REVERSION-TO-ETHYLENE SENSITIVITY1 n=1 Tax=Stephania cephalantha TaxID=152367 RepID=A0AAP0PNI9_9MAGN